MRTFLIAALLIIAAFAALPAAAQSDDAACTPAAYSDMLSDAAVALAEAETAADAEALLDYLMTDLRNLRAECNGLSFSKNGSVVAGPIELPAGTYIATADLSAFGILTFETLTDACRSDVIGLMLTAVDMAGGEAEVVLRTQAACTFLVSATTSGPWTLTFTPVG